MNPEAPVPVAREKAEKRPAFRWWFLICILVFAALIGWAFWPSESEISPYDLSRADGKSRFYATSYPKTQLPPDATVKQRFHGWWKKIQERFGKKNPAAWNFPATPVRFCSLSGLLTQCMEVSGTQYYIAVEISGTIEFGNTNVLNGAQWVTAFEHAIETNGPSICYDYGKKQNFKDKLLLIRDRPGVVKIVPESKLRDYEKSGLIKALR